MQRNVNTLEKLKELTKEEKKRRKKAIKLLEELTNELAYPLSELLGDECYKEIFTGHIWINNGLYYRHTEHREKEFKEDVGFYLTEDVSNGLPIWGVPLEDVKGRLFWQCVSDICRWVEKLPTIVEKHCKGRENLSYLKKIAECIEKNRSE